MALAHVFLKSFRFVRIKIKRTELLFGHQTLSTLQPGASVAEMLRQGLFC